MTKSRFSALILALIMSVTTLASTVMSAEKKILDVLVATSTTGNNWKQGIMLQKALVERGYDSELVHTANCHKNKKYIANTKRPGFYFIAGSSSSTSSVLIPFIAIIISLGQRKCQLSLCSFWRSRTKFQLCFCSVDV